MSSHRADFADTIVAVSTAAGASLRGIVRLSGPEAIPIISRIAGLPRDGLATLPRYGALDCRLLLASQNTSAPATLLLMRGPSSYTREDVVEVQVLGSPALLEIIVETLVAAGARLAEPGEFTRRAFLNGRLTLAQAEAVRGLIYARSEAAQRRALDQLAGAQAHDLTQAREHLIDLCALVEAGIDFSDQDIEVISGPAARDRVRRVLDECQRLLDYSRERVGTVGVPVALFGRPNVGKSSLMNLLAGAARSIVTDVPGTTRDVLEAEVAINGIGFRLIDTAGIRQTADALEADGVARARQALRSSEVGVFLLDGSVGLTHDDMAAWQDVSIPDCVIVLNKMDLGRRLSVGAVREKFGDHPVVCVSCLTGEGISELKDCLVSRVVSGRADASAHFFESSVRQREALRKTVDALQRAMAVIQNEGGEELTALELRTALDEIGELTGEAVTDDILERIFSEFCIGK